MNIKLKMASSLKTPHSVSFIDEAGEEQIILWDEEAKIKDEVIEIEDAYIVNYNESDELHYIADNFKYAIDNIEEEEIFSQFEFYSDEGYVVAHLQETENFAIKEMIFETFWEKSQKEAYPVKQENTDELKPDALSDNTVSTEVSEKEKYTSKTEIKEDFVNSYFKLNGKWYYPMKHVEKISSTPDAKEFEEKKLEISQQNIKRMEKQLEKSKIRTQAKVTDDLDR